MVGPGTAVVVPSNLSHMVAEIKTLASGPSPADMLLSIARYHMGEAGTEQARAKEAYAQAVKAAPAGAVVASTLNRDLVRMELSLAREAAKAAAQYCHRRLAAVAHTDADGNNIDIAALASLLGKLPQADLDQLERTLAFIAAATGIPDAAAPGAQPSQSPTSH